MSSASRYFKTTPLDSRFPTVNQANHCWNLYNEWVLCTKKAEEAGDDAKKCNRKRHNALALCPDEWVYYENHVTKTTQWERPVAPAAAPCRV